MILFGNDNMHYHLSASDREYQILAATNLLLYEAACWGCDNGYKTFHLGGGLGSKEDSLYKFKKAFNNNSNTYFSIGKKIFDQSKYDELIRIRKIEDAVINIESTFFPLYRA
jgi:lipid II:glycine glycyltransferase (peptidoglycan interpeptide bridge formation enzyme)